MRRLAFIVILISFPLLCRAEDLPQSPAGGWALDLSGGKQGYYYAEDVNDCFDKDLKDGFTIEFWFYPTRPVRPREWWSLVAKPVTLTPYVPLYQLRIEYFREHEGNEWMWLTEMVGGGGSSSYGLWWINSGEKYEPKWYHVILQGRIVGNQYNGILFLDGVSKGYHGGSANIHFNSDYPLFVGGLPPGAQGFIHLGGLDGLDEVKTEGRTFDGLIDELRISNIERYKPKPWGEKIKIKGRLHPDEHTVGLWHFDEGPKALRYYDASGNGHTLFAAGQLDVSYGGKTPLLWGGIKSLPAFKK